MERGEGRAAERERVGERNTNEGIMVRRKRLSGMLPVIDLNSCIFLCWKTSDVKPSILFYTPHSD